MGYDKQKAHDYYMKHRKLKGRKRKPKISAGKVSQRKRKRKVKYTAPVSAGYVTKSSGGKATVIKEKDYKLLKSQLDELKKRAVNLPPEKKKALKTSLNVIKGKIIKG